jgi:D-aminopeptidase
MVPNPHAICACHTAAVRWVAETNATNWEENHLWAMPVVAETYDGVPSDINGLRVTETHARAKRDAARPGSGARGKRR